MTPVESPPAQPLGRLPSNPLSLLAAMTAQFSPQSRRWWLALASLLAIFTICEVRADEWYMKIEGIKGEATHAKFPGWTRLESISSLLDRRSNPTNPPTGPAVFSCNVRKLIDSTSPKLLERCATSEKQPTVTLAFVRSSPPATQYRITLKEVFISSFTQAGSEGNPPSESMSLNFEKIEWTYLELDENGGNTGGQTATFDIVAQTGDVKSRPPFRATAAVQNGRNGIVITFPAERGHTYRMLGCPKIGEAWKTYREITAAEDGPTSQFIPMDQPSLLLKVEQVD